MQQNHKRIFKNTIYLYGREVVTLLLTLYSSRLLLKQLGVEDFGLYGLIGSILTMFSALRGLFSSSIQRFINVEKGLGNTQNISKIFSIGIVIHVIIAFVFVIIVEIAGLISIPTLNIHPDSFSSAYWILHFSVFAAAVTIMTVPYDALIIANEKFNIFAVFSIIESFLRLGIILLLQISPISKVVFYAFLMLLVSLIIRSMNAIYCKKYFKEETLFKITKDKKLLKNMLSFAGWQFFGNFGYSIMHTGLNFVINIFGGVTVNASRAIAYQVQTAVNKLSSNINISFQPQSVMLYSKGDRGGYYKMMLMNTKASFAITAIVSSFVIIMAPSLLKFWLGDVPKYSTEFVQAIFFYTVIRSLHSPIDTLFKAAGKLKDYQICEIIILSLNLPFSILILKMGLPYFTVFILMGIIEFVNLCSILFIANRKLGFESFKYIKAILPKLFLFIVACFTAFYMLTNYLNNSISVIWIIVRCVLVLLISGLFVLIITFNINELTILYKTVVYRKKK